MTEGMMLLAYLPDVDVVTPAVEAGWPYGVIVFVMVTFIAALAWLGRTQALSLDNANKFIREQLLVIVAENQKAFQASIAATTALTDALNRRLCLLDPNVQNGLVDHILDRIDKAHE
jgi:hypothetical protein